LLDVVDNLERAIAAAGDQESPLVEGIRLTQKSMLTVLEKHGVQLIDPAGEAFNADLHQAVGIAPDVAANVVGVVLQKGYSLNGRLLRPAMVMVGQ
jgi:molecular chaperone GrpE